MTNFFSGPAVLRRTASLAVFLTAAVAFAAAQAGYYRSAKVDADGQLHIVLTSGKEFLPSKLSGQKTFGSPILSADHSTIGWLVEWPNPAYKDYRPIATPLVLYRSGQTLRTFSPDQGIYVWKFENEDQNVAYCTGGAYGGATSCDLRSIKSGRLLGQWGYDEHVAKYPAWIPPRWITEELRQPAVSP